MFIKNNTLFFDSQFLDMNLKLWWVFLDKCEESMHNGVVNIAEFLKCILIWLYIIILSIVYSVYVIEKLNISVL